MTRSQNILLAFAALAALAIIATSPLVAQSPAPNKSAPTASAAVPALLLSDIHLDPFTDPAKVARLNAAPAAEWPAILSEPVSSTQQRESAALQTACPVRSTDTSYVLWRSSLQAIRANGAHARFITLSGDLLAHSFECKYQAILPHATQEDYLAFTVKTVRVIASTLRGALPGVPLYLAMGNNDSGCGDYALDTGHDAFLARVAQIVAESLPADLSSTDRAAVLADFASGGHYSAPLAGVPRTRLIVLDDIFLSTRYTACSGKPQPAPAAAQIAWLAAQLARARKQHQRVWVMAHIPPGVDLYSTVRKAPNLCSGGRPLMFLGSELLAQTIANNADIVRLALFGHTHSDEMRLLTPSPGPTKAPAQPAVGVPVKIVASITPINGNRPTFTVASIDPATASLADYTVFMASNLTGVAAVWSPEYTYSATYRLPAFDAPSLATLVSGLQSDRAARTPASQSYQFNYFPGSLSAAIHIAWPQYACSLNHDSAAAFTACACSAAAPATK